jgi:glycosyltransferase involved in cell wall biosynthesis
VTEQTTVAPRRTVSLLLICQSYPPVIGGSEIEAQRICAALQKRGHRVEVVCAGGPPMPDQKEWIDPEGVPVRMFGNRMSEPWRSYCYALGVAWTIFRRRKDCDVVYFLMSGLQLVTGLPAGRWTGKRIIMKFSGSSLILAMTRSRLGRLELGLLRRWADRIMVLNQGLVDEAREAGLDLKKLLWMPNPVDTDEFVPPTAEGKSELRRELKLPEGGRFVLFVGRVAPEKELWSLIDGFSRIAKQHPQVCLVFVGDGPSRAGLQEQAHRLGLEDQVRFAGMVRVSDVRKWMQASDIFALVSSLEGLPCSLIEAMSIGLPAVVSDIPANTQLIDSGVEGLVARAKDPLSIAAALQTLLEDAAQRQRFGAAARQRVLGTFSTRSVVTIYEKMFDEILDSNPVTSSAR